MRQKYIHSELVYEKQQKSGIHGWLKSMNQKANVRMKKSFEDVWTWVWILTWDFRIYQINMQQIKQVSQLLFFLSMDGGSVFCYKILCEDTTTNIYIISQSM